MTRRKMTAPELHIRQSSTQFIPVAAMEHHAEMVRRAELRWSAAMLEARHSEEHRDHYLATYGEHEIEGGKSCFEWIAVTAYGKNEVCGYFIVWNGSTVHVMDEDITTCESMFRAATAAKRIHEDNP